MLPISISINSLPFQFFPFTLAEAVCFLWRKDVIQCSNCTMWNVYISIASFVRICKVEFLFLGQEQVKVNFGV